MPKKKNKKDRKIHKQRDFVCILYPDNPNHAFLILMLRTFKYNCVGVRHNLDEYLEDVIDENGEVIHQKGDLKKEHYHFILRFPNPRYISGVADELEIEEHLVDFLDDFKGYATYMLHWDEPQKHQYEVTDFVGNLAGDTARKLQNVPEDTQMLAIIKYIYSIDRIVKKKDVLDYVLTNGYYGCYRRSYTMLRDIIDEHNMVYYGGYNQRNI